MVDTCTPYGDAAIELLNQPKGRSSLDRCGAAAINMLMLTVMEKYLSRVRFPDQPRHNTTAPKMRSFGCGGNICIESGLNNLGGVPMAGRVSG